MSRGPVISESSFTSGLRTGAVAPAPAAVLAAGEPRPRILLIDDREEERYLLRSILVSETDCEVLESSSPVEGFRLAELAPPALIFIDLIMPEQTGFELLERFQASPQLRPVPVVVHSGFELSPQDRARLSGAYAILSKTQATEEELFTQVAGIVAALQLPRKRRLA